MEHEDAYEEFDEDYKSKSQIKREMLALQDLARELIQSTRIKVESLPVDEKVIDAISKARTLKKQALKRQIQYIGGLLQHEDEAALRLHIQHIEQPHQEQVEAFHQLEALRDSLVADEDGAFEQVLSQYPQADRQHLRQLVRNARKEQEQQKPPKSARAIFRYLRDLED